MRQKLTWPGLSGCWWPPSAGEWRSLCLAAWHHILPPPAPYSAPGYRTWWEHADKTLSEHADSDCMAAALTQSVQARLNTSVSEQTAASSSCVSSAQLQHTDRFVQLFSFLHSFHLSCARTRQKRQKSAHPLPATLTQDYFHIAWLMLTAVQIYWSNTCQCQNAHGGVSYSCTTEQTDKKFFHAVKLNHLILCTDTNYDLILNHLQF